MSAAALLSENPNPNDADIDQAMRVISVAAACMAVSVKLLKPLQVLLVAEQFYDAMETNHG